MQDIQEIADGDVWLVEMQGIEEAYGLTAISLPEAHVLSDELLRSLILCAPRGIELNVDENSGHAPVKGSLKMVCRLVSCPVIVIDQEMRYAS
jgi:hypothetical protein